MLVSQPGGHDPKECRKLIAKAGSGIGRGCALAAAAGVVFADINIEAPKGAAEERRC